MKKVDATRPVFCVERDDHVDVWRVLHGERDVPTWMMSTEL